MINIDQLLITLGSPPYNQEPKRLERLLTGPHLFAGVLVRVHQQGQAPKGRPVDRGGRPSSVRRQKDPMGHRLEKSIVWDMIY